MYQQRRRILLTDKVLNVICEDCLTAPVQRWSSWRSIWRRRWPPAPRQGILAATLCLWTEGVKNQQRRFYKLELLLIRYVSIQTNRSTPLFRIQIHRIRIQALSWILGTLRIQSDARPRYFVSGQETLHIKISKTDIQAFFSFPFFAGIFFPLRIRSNQDPKH